jgi:N-acetyl-gamma-glutamyl-phosphate reductase
MGSAGSGIRKPIGCDSVAAASPSRSAARWRERGSWPTGLLSTAALLALALADAGLLLSSADIIVDAKSGVSGAGKTPSSGRTSRKCTAACRPTVCSVIATAPKSSRASAAPSPSRRTWCRSIAASSRRSTCASRRAPPRTFADVYEAGYEDATFVRLVGASLPEIKHVAHTNFCDIGWRVDPSGRAIVVSVIDNLLKGASGQAVQNLNVMLGLDETAGLL